MSITWREGHDRDYDSSTVPASRPMKPTYDGVVIDTFVRSDQVMSDIWEMATYARVWDGEKIVNVHANHAAVTIDATPEVLVAVTAFEAAAEVARAKAAHEASIDRTIEYARTIARDKHVTVVRGRKVKKGTEGRVFWMRPSTWGDRVGLELADGTRVFTAKSNVEVTNPDEYLDVEELMAAA